MIQTNFGQTTTTTNNLRGTLNEIMTCFWSSRGLQVPQHLNFVMVFTVKFFLVAFVAHSEEHGPSWQSDHNHCADDYCYDIGFCVSLVLFCGVTSVGTAHFS
jgi:hypothetical protein